MKGRSTAIDKDRLCADEGTIDDDRSKKIATWVVDRECEEAIGYAATMDAEGLNEGIGCVPMKTK